MKRPSVPCSSRRRPIQPLLAVVGGLCATLATAQGPPTVTLEQIMSHPEWLGRAPQNAYWDESSEAVYYSRATPTKNGVDLRRSDLYRQALDATDGTKIEAESLGGTQPRFSLRSPSGNRVLWTRDGDLFMRDGRGAVQQLTRTHDRERSPFFLTDGRIGFLRGQNSVYARDLDTGLEEQLFRVEAQDEPTETQESKREKRPYVSREEERLLDWVSDERQRELDRRAQRELRAEDPTTADRAWYLGKDIRVLGLFPSPDGRHLLVRVSAKGGEPKRTQMPTYVSSSGDIEVRDVRPKVGTEKPVNQRLVLLDRESRLQAEVALDELPTRRDDPLKELREAAKERETAKQSDDDPNSVSERSRTGKDEPKGRGKNKRRQRKSAADGDVDSTEEAAKAPPRPVAINTVFWAPDGSFAVAQAFSRDNKDRWIVQIRASVETEGEVSQGEAEASALSATTRVLHHQHDPAWINWSFRNVGLLPESNDVYFLSETSGYSHLYLVEAEGIDDPASASALTNGPFVVDQPQPSRDGRSIFFTSNELHPGRTEVYRIDLDIAGDHTTTQLTDFGGLNGFALSPNDQHLLVTHSTTTTPPELYATSAQQLTAIGSATRLTRTVSQEFTAFEWTKPTIVEVPSTHHDRPIFSRLYLPKTTAAEELRPAVIFVHGAGYLQNAHMGWSGYFREFMFHTLLNQHGYVVLDMDYRASKGYGRDWRTAIYRQMGWPEVEDLSDGVRYLAEEHGVDPNRVGVYGGSYGGFLTFMALFNEPELFAAGAALRPVTDWAHYNHPYTSNILNTPQIDPEAYQKSSPIEFADGLNKPLLIAAGVLDDNVFFQDSVRLVQKLIELEKKDWELAIYPIEPHGFREPSSWLDEYRRIFELFEEHVR